MLNKTRSGETSREKFRMVRALLPDTPRPPQIQPELPNKKNVENSIFPGSLQVPRSEIEVRSKWYLGGLEVNSPLPISFSRLINILHLILAVVWYTLVGKLWNLEKLGFHEKLDLLAPYGNWGGFDKTEACGKIVRIFMGPGSQIFCLTE